MLTCHACGHDDPHEPECTAVVDGDLCPCAEVMPAPTQPEEVPEP